MAQKGRRLNGGAISEEAISSSPTVLGSTQHGQAPGLQQFYSPPELSQFCWQALDEPGEPVLDVAAGDGSLLSAWPRESSFGIEVDPDQARSADGRYTPLVGDLQRLYPILRATGVRFPNVVANPPWGLRWEVSSLNEGRSASSSLLGYKMALGLMAPGGLGAFVVGADRFRREIQKDEDSRFVWCLIEVPDLFDGVRQKSVIAFFAGPDSCLGGGAVRLKAKRAELVDLGDEIDAARESKVGGTFHYLTPANAEEMFSAAREEHDRRLSVEASKRPAFDVRLRGKRIAVNLSAFAQVALRENEGYDALKTVQGFDRKALTYLALNLRDWRLVERCAADETLSLDPALVEAASRALAELERELCPIYPVRPQMRLGFLEDLEQISCRRDDPERGFRAGERYPISTRSQINTDEEERPYEKRDGTMEVRSFEIERKLLKITIGGQTFDEGTESIEYLLGHFEIPDPGHIGERFPEETARARAILETFPRRFGWAEKGIEWKDLEREGGEVEVWQREDLARLIVKGGALGWEQGGGKTLGLTALAIASIEYWGLSDQAMFVVPQDLIPQWQREVKRFFGLEFELIDSIAKARAVRRKMHRGEHGFYITWYEMLTLTGARRRVLPVVPVEVKRLERRAGSAAARSETVKLSSEEACPACHGQGHHGWNGEVCKRCGYAHRELEIRCAASHLATAFRRGVICTDELSEIRGQSSRRSKAVRALRAACRYGGSGTPISNYVNDAFWGLWWTFGNATPCFPYDYHGGPKQFQEDFCVLEYLMGREEDEEAHVRKWAKVLPEVTNVSILWRLLSAGLVRRRQEDMGKMVSRREVPVEVPMGRAQLAMHKAWLQRFPAFFKQKYPDHELVGSGAVERFAAVLGQRVKLEYASTLPPADPDADWIMGPESHEASHWTPAMLKTLELALKHCREGKKILIGSILVEAGLFIAERLCERGVKAVHITEQGKDGKHRTKNPRKRAAEVAAFAQGDAQVLCTGIKAMRLGHNLDVASVAIVLGFPESHEALDQFIKRIHRLSSKLPVVIYFVYPKNSMGEKKKKLLTNKGKASDLALDGQLIDVPEKPIDWRKVTKEMKEAGVSLSADDTVDEAGIKDLWEAAEGPYASLRPALSLVTASGKQLKAVDPDETEQLDLFVEAA